MCAPLPFPDGSTLHEIEGIHYAVWRRTGGRSPDELGDEELAILGRLLARIHNVGATAAAPHRPRLDSATSALAPLRFLETSGFLPREVPAPLPRGGRAGGRALRRLERRASPCTGSTATATAGNLLHGDEGWFFLDFDDFVTGPAVHDVWMLVPGRDAEGARQRELLIEGYRQFRDFDASWLRLVEPLRAFRFVFYAAWIAKRWRDPAFPSAFPHFGTAEYWENETRDLEEHVERLLRGGSDVPETLRPTAVADEGPELTNKDFFWDL